jgi:hypothetical protein
MTSTTNRALLIGGVPLANSDQVFRQVGASLGRYLDRIPDGETGERRMWIGFQRNVLLESNAMEIDTAVPPLKFIQWDGKLVREIPGLRFEAGTDLSKVVFETGYDRAAIESYAIFRRLRDSGDLPSHLRFQVCLATPAATAWLYVSPGARDQYLPVYERSLLGALRKICENIPKQDLSIQWDVCQEVLVFENYFADRPSDYKQQIFGLHGRLGDAVPAGVELGFHLCYGSPADEHLVQPKDAKILVEMMNGIGAAVTRSLDFLHIPVPKERNDDGFFSPLRDWRRRPETRLFLGLIHHGDATGDAARIAAARRHVADFGIASECGWARTDPSHLPGLLEAHRQAAAAM